jgi:hypothetical protein
MFYIHIFLFFTCDEIALHSFTLTHEMYIFLLYTYPLYDLYIKNHIHAQHWSKPMLACSQFYAHSSPN